MVKKSAKAVAGAAVGFALCFTSSVASAATPSFLTSPVSPFVALAAYGTAQSGSAVCATAVGAAGAAAATQAQASTQGCVLPVLDPAVAAAPVGAPPVAYAPVAGGGLGLGVGAILAGLIAVAGLAAVVLSSKGKGNLPVSPD